MGIFDFSAKTIGIDPGSSRLRIINGGHLVFNEPTLLSIDAAGDKVTGYGSGAVLTDDLIRPIAGTMADFYGFEQLLRWAIKKSLRKKTWLPIGHVLHIALPITATEIERRAYRDAAEHTGAKEVHFLHQPFCSATAMNILPNKKNFVVIDFGAGKIEITVFDNAQPIAVGIVHFGTLKLKKIIKSHLFRNYKLTPTNEELEATLHSVGHKRTQKSFLLNGQLIDKEGALSSLIAYLRVVEDEILDVWERAAGKNANMDSIMVNGIYFTGGGSHIQWIAKRISKHTKLPYTVSTAPELDTIRGLGQMLAQPEHYPRSAL